MYAIPGLIALVSFIYLRPQEILPALHGVPLFYVFALLVVVGWVLDVRLGVTRLRGNALLGWGCFFFGWSGLMLAAAPPGTVMTQAIVMSTSFLLFATLAHAVQTVRGVRAVAAALLVLSLALGVVGLHQASAPLGCVKQDDLDPGVWRPDGRACTDSAQCMETRIDPSARYRCERLGLLGTTSVEGRVRYRGIMEDPNELALVLAVALPFAFAPFQLRRSGPRWLLAVGALALFALCTIYTRSRSGQLAFVAVLATYLFRRLRWSGLAAAALLGAPVLLLGGRADLGADQSTSERLECWSVAIELFRSSPLLGLGRGQFVEHHYLTAHNAFLLALAEMGLPGLFLLTSLYYLAFKATLSAAKIPGPERVWANAVFSSLCATVVSAFFLSLTNNHVPWIVLGLAGAVAESARARNPGWRLRLSWRDAAVVATIDAVLIAAIFVYTRIKGA